MRLLGLFVLIAVLVAGCATYTEKKSPCVCNWQPVAEQDEAMV